MNDVRFFNIVWDTDGIPEPSLPLSDRFGFCVESFQFE